MRRAAVIIAASMVVGGCAGNGDGLDENGRPLDSGPLPLAPTFASIQQNVFTPICTACHAGASAPLGLRLDEASAYAAIVNTASVEVPALRRIQPGNPDASYLIQKIEGRAAIGGRMPLNLPPLPQATIDVIRQWVADGAQRPAAATSSMKPATLVAVNPFPDEIIDGGPGEILIGSPNAIDTTLIQTGAFTVVRSGGDGSFDEGNEVVVDTLQLSVRSQEPTVLVATNSQPWIPDSYRITIAGNGAVAAEDRDGRPIDGDADGRAGGDFVVYFEVGRSL